MTTQQQDYERFEELGKAMQHPTAQFASTAIYQMWWRERESIINKYGGMPPKPDIGKTK